MQRLNPYIETSSFQLYAISVIMTHHDIMNLQGRQLRLQNLSYLTQSSGPAAGKFLSSACQLLAKRREACGMAEPSRAACQFVKMHTGWLVGNYTGHASICPLMLCNVCSPVRVSTAESRLLSF